MKKNKILGLAALLLAIIGLALSSCAELDAFVDGYNYGRSLGYETPHNQEIQEITDL